MYKVYQKPGTEQDVNYDSTVYMVCVSVFVDENGGLYTVSAVNEADSAQKAKGIVFENTPPEPNESSTGSPITGDENHLGLWLISMTVSFFGAAICFLLWKSNGDRKEQPRSSR